MHQDGELPELIERLADDPAVRVHVTPADGDLFSGESHHAFDLQVVGIPRRAKGDRLPSLRRAPAKCQPIDQHSLARPQHGFL